MDNKMACATILVRRPFLLPGNFERMLVQKDRDLSFDAFRGLVIVAVVATHAIEFRGSSYGLGFLYFRQLLNFTVPALFFMAGFWSSKEHIVSLGGYATYLTKRLSRILIPYLFWSVILLGYSAVRERDIDGYKIMYKLLTGGACMGYYFIMPLAQLYIMTPLLEYVNRRLGVYGLVLVFVFNIASIGFLYLSRLFNVIGPLPVALLFYSWVIYYEIGLFVRGRYDRVPTARKVRLGILFAILLSWLLSGLEASIVLSRYDKMSFAVFFVKYSTLLYSLCVILGFLVGREYFGRLPKVFGAIGQYSFGIYLINVIILGWVADIFQRFSVIHSFQPLYQFVLVAATVLICLVLISATRKLLPEFFCSRILGF
jgi:fucose 4-O-acetylase-like acetyltransferase